MTDSSALFDDATGPDPRDISDWTDLGREMWSYLTNRGAVVNYSFVDMTVEVPRDIGPDAPRATWKLNGTLRITTSDDQMPVSVQPSASGAATGSPSGQTPA